MPHPDDITRDVFVALPDDGVASLNATLTLYATDEWGGAQVSVDGQGVDTSGKPLHLSGRLNAYPFINDEGTPCVDVSGADLVIGRSPFSRRNINGLTQRNAIRYALRCAVVRWYEDRPEEWRAAIPRWLAKAIADDDREIARHQTLIEQITQRRATRMAQLIQLTPTDA